MVLLMVAAGGLVGASLRYLVSTWVQGAAGDGAFPYGTLAVNAAGCLANRPGRRVRGGPAAPQLRGAGVPGRSACSAGFTTFSAFGIDTIKLIRDSAYIAASANVVLQVAVGLAAVVIGLRLAQWGYERLASGQ